MFFNFRIWKAFKITFNVRSTVLIPVRRAPPVPGASIQHTHRFSWNAIWGNSSPKQVINKDQLKDVLRVNAAQPISFQGSLPSHSSSNYNFAESNAFASIISSNPAESIESIVKGPAKLPSVWENPLKSNR